MTAREIEAARRAMTRYVKRGGQIWIRVFPDVPITKKPLEVRMGSGKGNVEYWVAQVQPGKVLFEMEGVTEDDRARGVPARRVEALGRHAVRQAAGALMKSERAADEDASGETCSEELLKLRREQFNLRMAQALGPGREAGPVRQGAPEHRAPEDGAGERARATR